MHLYPQYYNEFKCIGSLCKHNCCIGWEIDIDETTYDFYKTVGGSMGQRLCDSIEHTEPPHFILSADERCPFLNTDNLCDIIITMGDNSLCDICRQHPRFHNELPQRVESGLGLCCEQAACMILSEKRPFRLIGSEDITTDDQIIILRDEILSVLTDRAQPLSNRLSDMLTICDTMPTDKSIDQWCDVLLNLECMDSTWHKLIASLKAEHKNLDADAFDTYMASRECEYEQFCVYLIYRHFANSPNTDECKKRAAFVAFSHKILRLLGMMLYCTKGEFTFEDQVELARMFSSEIEYSDENIYKLYGILT